MSAHYDIYSFNDLVDLKSVNNYTQDVTIHLRADITITDTSLQNWTLGGRVKFDGHGFTLTFSYTPSTYMFNCATYQTEFVLCNLNIEPPTSGSGGWLGYATISHCTLRCPLYTISGVGTNVINCLFTGSGVLSIDTNTTGPSVFMGCVFNGDSASGKPHDRGVIRNCVFAKAAFAAGTDLKFSDCIMLSGANGSTGTRTRCLEYAANKLCTGSTTDCKVYSDLTLGDPLPTNWRPEDWLQGNASSYPILRWFKSFTRNGEMQRKEVWNGANYTTHTSVPAFKAMVYTA